MKTQDSIIASRYARAFFQAAQAAKSEEKILRELHQLNQLMKTDAALANALRHPLLSLADKKKSAAKALGQTPSVMLDRLLDLILDKKRLHLLPYVTVQFEHLFDEANGILKIQMKSATPLSKEQVQAIEARFTKSRGNKKVVIESSLDETLLGGLLLRVGDKVWDFSLREKLRRMKEDLLAAAAVG